MILMSVAVHPTTSAPGLQPNGLSNGSHPQRSGASPLATVPEKPVNASPSASLDEFAGDPNFMTSLARGL
ncbi:MAG TPA: hypothetical protein VJU82_11955, partial [Acidobacteriaceae bacterium]|nr:hypothetical protein [Acidobacteriaceae bacterium]